MNQLNQPKLFSLRLGANGGLGALHLFCDFCQAEAGQRQLSKPLIFCGATKQRSFLRLQPQLD
jgi:hypothetical protein